MREDKIAAEWARLRLLSDDIASHEAAVAQREAAVYAVRQPAHNFIFSNP